jgi:hypothetical protein
MTWLLPPPPRTNGPVSYKICQLFTNIICYREVYQNFSGGGILLGWISYGENYTLEWKFPEMNFPGEILYGRIFQNSCTKFVYFSFFLVGHPILNLEKLWRNYPGEIFIWVGILSGIFTWHGGFISGENHHGGIITRRNFHREIFCRRNLPLGREEDQGIIFHIRGIPPWS